jgi:hypothetical protein
MQNKNGDEQDLQSLARDEMRRGNDVQGSLLARRHQCVEEIANGFWVECLRISVDAGSDEQRISYCQPRSSVRVESTSKINGCPRSLACDLAKLRVLAAPPTTVAKTIGITTILLALTNTSPRGLNDTAKARPRNPMAALRTPTSTCACYWRPNRVSGLIGRSPSIGRILGLVRKADVALQVRSRRLGLFSDAHKNLTRPGSILRLKPRVPFGAAATAGSGGPR